MGRKLKIISVVATVLLCAGLAASIALANRHAFPAEPELTDVELAAPKNATPAPELARLLTARHRHTRAGEVLQEARQALAGSRWPADGQRLLDAIARRSRPTVAAFRRALLAEGCLPTAATLASTPQVDHMLLLRYVRLLIYRVVARAQLHRGPRAAVDLETLQRRLLALQRDCTHQLLATMVLDHALTLALRAWGYLLAAPEREGEALQQRIWAGIRALERRPDPLPGALRREHEVAFRTFEALQAGGRGDGLGSWPWFDAQQTRRMLRQIGRRNVWLAERPMTEAPFFVPSPEERFFERLLAAPAWLTAFRYNGAGLAMLAAFGTTTTVVRSRIATWRLRRCRQAAQRAAWAGELRRRGRALAPAALAAVPPNPFTGEPFPPAPYDAQAPGPCALPGAPDPPRGLELLELPPALGAPPAAAGAPSPPRQ